MGLTWDDGVDLVGFGQLGCEKRKDGGSELYQVFVGGALLVGVIAEARGQLRSTWCPVDGVAIAYRDETRTFGVFQVACHAV